MWGNDFSRVNTSEIGYRLVVQEGAVVRPNEDHTPKKCIIRDARTKAARHCFGKYRLHMDVLKCDKEDDGTFTILARNIKDGTETKFRTKSVSFHVNRRIGKKRIVDYPGSDKFRGKIVYGMGNEVKAIDFWKKKVLVVGMGAFAFENARTAIEKGAQSVTLMGRRSGSCCPKFIDMIAFLRPLDKNLNTNKAGNMISFDGWKQCYLDAKLKTPECWDEGLLKPDGHTISVSDVVYIAGFHGMSDIKVGEIKNITGDGMGVDLKDGSTINTDVIIKCTGFHLNGDVETITGKNRMYPDGLLAYNMNYGAEPLLDAGQFGGSAKGYREMEQYERPTDEQIGQGLEKSVKQGFNGDYLLPKANPFGSGQGGAWAYLPQYWDWLLSHPEEQKAMLKYSGEAPMAMSEIWASQVGKLQWLIMSRILAAVGKNN
eukprot:gnl/TRDRNA2_/TRDRNA2_149708_c0_seq1.p1 gnl/TRDRNA2_/TRDRNA2_149708_c0~~gnl/TRDRNA2_/TRDRNA2_149708_c0_seq1.p1  ORF type:complete len:443 (-),score=86.80 gnl/TRDRNA2_/TRDRNA2_149708_c0_seq1:84-1370(-)